MIVLNFNLNGARSAATKGFLDWLQARPQIDACLFQETKAARADLAAFEARLRAMGFSHVQWHCAEKKGYSGTGLCSRLAPQESFEGFGAEEFDREGRLCAARFGALDLASCYFPSGSAGPERQASKLRFLDAFEPWLHSWPGQSAIVGADLNIAHANLDLRNWKGNVEAPGCTAVERAWMDRWLAQGWIDCARGLRPNESFYTWWSQRAGARARDVGWRIDAQICKGPLRAVQAVVEREPIFSDHAPLWIQYEGSFADWAAGSIA